MKETTTQRSSILDHLKEKGELTSIEAFQYFGATRLSAHIFELRKHGHIIDTIDCVTVNRYGSTTNYAKYKYVGFNGLDNTIAIRKLRGEL